MPTFFPRQTANWKLEEPAAFRRLSLSLVEMALLTGVALRLLRSLALTHGSNSWLYLGGFYGLFWLIFFGMATAHLGNYPIHHWLWRAPLFGVVEAAGEMLASLALIALRREPMGTDRASMRDWPGMAVETTLWHVVAIVLFALLLAGVVQLVRYTLLRAEHREHTVAAIHEEIERERAEQEQANSGT